MKFYVYSQDLNYGHGVGGTAKLAREMPLNYFIDTLIEFRASVPDEYREVAKVEISTDGYTPEIEISYEREMTPEEILADKLEKEESRQRNRATRIAEIQNQISDWGYTLVKK
jgi:hypothetical protein